MNAANSHESRFATGGQRCGVVAVVLREAKFLTIRRSQFVTAPRSICFPGGGIEKGESERQAVIRELHEELGLQHVTPIRRIWRCVTRRRVRLAWWLTEVPDQPLQLNYQEVEASAWYTAEEMLATECLLDSNRDFLAALRAGHFDFSTEIP